MDKGSLIRSIVLLAALVNQALVFSGKSPIPYSSEEIEAGVTMAFTVIASLVAWFRNNYITKKGDLQKKVLQAQGLIKK
jgi:SPP1 family holin